MTLIINKQVTPKVLWFPEKGPAGEPGKSFKYRGDWDIAVQYTGLSDMVTYRSSLYHAVRDTIGEVPGTTDAWELVLTTSDMDYDAGIWEE